MVKVLPLGDPVVPRRLGFMEGQISVPDDFNRMGEDAILALFAEQP